MFNDKEEGKVPEEKKRRQVKSSEDQGQVYTPYPGADEKYDNGHRDWRLYNPKKYHDPLWSPDKE
ncbi:MAG: hypothetical protein ACOCVM_09290 [Desulfovibrionaceae bacterium]